MLEIRQLEADDLVDARRLSTQAGWNQTGADWRRLRTLCPDGCFAGTVDGTLVATTTVMTYGDSSWIGMVLVDEAHRSNGYGSRLFERGLEYARIHGGDTVGLDATSLGEPIYRRYGFERAEPVFRWRGQLRPSGKIGLSDGVHRSDGLDSGEIESLGEFDRRHLGDDRRPLLRELVAERDVRVFRVRDSNTIGGYAIVRPGRSAWHIGPVVADPRAVGPLFRAVADAFEGREVIADAPDRNGISKLESIGLSRDRELVRMTYPDARAALRTDAVWAFVDFAFG
ncbi:GNAT family N-acetyltransferase (plasmid) [Haloferacaceae archaeon DSL9]